MYKRASRNLQHAHRVNRPLPTGGFIGASTDETDLLPSADNLSLAEVRAERRQLRADQVRLEADLAAAKARDDKREIVRIGQAISVICKRTTPLRAREHALNGSTELNALRDAVRQVVPADLLQEVWNRAAEIAADPVRGGS